MSTIDPGGGGGAGTLPLHAGIADMFTALHLHDGNAIWRNVFSNYNAAAGRHVDDYRFNVHLSFWATMHNAVGREGV